MAWRRRVRWRYPALLALVLIAVGAGTATALVRSGGGSAPRASGATVDRVVPAGPLLDEHGRATSLAAFRGRLVVLSPFLTLCHEVCPLTTASFLQMRRAVAAAGLAGRVAFVEVSVDPWRDAPARLRAYRRLTGAEFPLLTGTKGELTRFWRSFGVAFWRSPEGTPADRDWLTGRPLTFDVTHTDGLFVVDATGRWRIVQLGPPSVAGAALSPTLKGLLNATGKRDLRGPQAGWTVRQGLDDIGSLLGRRIPDAPAGG